MKAVVAAFNQEKALVGASSVVTNLRMDLFEFLVSNHLVVVKSVPVTGEHIAAALEHERLQLLFALKIAKMKC